MGAGARRAPPRSGGAPLTTRSTSPTTCALLHTPQYAAEDEEPERNDAAEPKGHAVPPLGELEAAYRAQLEVEQRALGGGEHVAALAAAPLDTAAVVRPLDVAAAVLDVKASADALREDAEEHLAAVKVGGSDSRGGSD